MNKQTNTQLPPLPTKPLEFIICWSAPEHEACPGVVDRLSVIPLKKTDT